LLELSWIRCFVLALLGFVVRIPALQGEPIWDDDYLTRSNPFIRSPLFLLEVFRQHLFPESYSAHYRPVQNISYMTDYLLWNGNFYGFHLSSLLIHVAAGILLYLLLQNLFVTLLQKKETVDAGSGYSAQFASWFAFFVALLWIVHPVHSAAIDYVSGRADSLAVFFGCAAWLLFLRARRIPGLLSRVGLFLISWLTGLLALCSRENGSLWPVLLLLYTFAFERGSKRWHRAAILVACLLLFATYYGLRQLPADRPVSSASSDWTPELRGILMLRAMGDYARLMIYPANLHMERTVFSPAAYMSQKGREGAVEFEYLSLAGVALLTGFVLLSMRRSPGQRVRIFGAAWFILTYLPISNLVELNATVAEHWLYLPSIGFLIFTAGCAVDIPIRWRRVAVAFVTVAVVALGVRSAFRSSDWASNETFARQTMKSGGATVRVALLLGQVYSNRGDYVKAEAILRKAVQLCPDYPFARNNLAHALMHVGKEKEAEALFAASAGAAHEARKEYPRTWIAALNVAHSRELEQDEPGAIAVLEKARADYPDTWQLISTESELLRNSDKLAAAMNIVAPFAHKYWWHHGAWMAMGRLLAQQNQAAAAAAALRHASWLDLHETDALNLLAMILVRQNRMADAVTIQQRAVARQPDQPQQYLLLSNLLDKAGRAGEARVALGQVTRLRLLATAGKASN
jgi:Flp pilus assembly protein TadD